MKKSIKILSKIADSVLNFMAGEKLEESLTYNNLLDMLIYMHILYS